MRLTYALLISMFMFMIPLKSWAPVPDIEIVELGVSCIGKHQEVVCRTLQYKDHVVVALQSESIKVEIKEVAEILGTIAHESGGKQSARGHSGEIGLMQLMPGTARVMKVNPFDVKGNILGGVRYRKTLRDAFGFSGNMLLGAYNAGPGNALKGRVKSSYIRSVQTWTKIFKEILDKEYSYG